MKYDRYIGLRLPPLWLDGRLSRYRLSEIQTYMNLYSCALITYNHHTPIRRVNLLFDRYTFSLFLSNKTPSLA